MQSVNSKGAVGTRPAAPDLFYSVCLLLKLTYVRSEPFMSITNVPELFGSMVFNDAVMK